MSDTQDKSLHINSNKLRFTSQDKRADSSDSEWTFTLQAKPGRVAIVYPSMCSPLIKKSSDPLRLYVLVDQAFKDTFDFSPVVASQIVGVYLKFEKWSDYRAGQSSVAEGLRPAPKDQPLCESWQQAQKDISLNFIGELNAVNGKIPNADNQLFAILHPNAQQWYQSHRLHYLFRIDIAPSNITLSQAGDQELWALSWLVPTGKNESLFEQYQDQLIQEYNHKYVNKQKDRILAYKIDAELIFDEDPASPMQSHHPVYIYNGDHLNLGQLTDVHVSSRQHVFDKGKPRVVDGVSEVVGTHVNKSYTPLKNLMDHFGQDADTQLLVFTGDLVDYGRNFDPASAKGKAIKNSGDLWAVMDLDLLRDESLYPHYIDLRIMYSLFLHYYDTYQKPILLTSGNHEGYTVPYGISPRVTTKDAGMGAASGLWNKTKNGIRSGWNTLAFWQDDPDPYALRDLSDFLEDERTSRLKYVEGHDETGMQGGVLANEGIPADHNLTIYEACLLYGPDYGRVVMKGSLTSATNTNFNPENYRWFYTLFTPITDLWISVGQQTLIALNWGEGEKMIQYVPFKSFLPQSTEGLTDNQVNLIQAALAKNSATNILCAHFTIANYDPKHSYEEKDAKTGQYVPRQAPVGVGDYNSRDPITDYTTGTFQENRQFLLQQCIQQGKITLTMSGHSHRSGLYQDVGIFPSEPRYMPNPHPGMPPREIPPANDMKVQSHAPQQDGRYDYAHRPNKGLFLVTASGGPMPVQNYRGEMLGYGIVPPSGSSVKFDGSKPDIQVIEYNQGSSKPRFCVAMDFMDVLGPLNTEDKEGVFERFECEDDLGDEFADQIEIQIQVNQRRFPDVPIFKEGKLHIYLDEEGGFVSLPFTVKYGGKKKHIAALKNEWLSSAADWSFGVLQNAQRTENNLYFLELLFDETQLPSITGYHQYNYESKWYIQMKIYPREETVTTSRGTRKKQSPGFRLERDPGFGTVPSFKWRGQKFGDEYKVPSKYSN